MIVLEIILIVIVVAIICPLFDDGPGYFQCKEINKQRRHEELLEVLRVSVSESAPKQTEEYVRLKEDFSASVERGVEGFQKKIPLVPFNPSIPLDSAEFEIPSLCPKCHQDEYDCNCRGCNTN